MQSEFQTIHSAHHTQQQPTSRHNIPKTLIRMTGSCPDMTSASKALCLDMDDVSEQCPVDNSRTPKPYSNRFSSSEGDLSARSSLPAACRSSGHQGSAQPPCSINASSRTPRRRRSSLLHELAWNELMQGVLAPDDGRSTMPVKAASTPSCENSSCSKRSSGEARRVRWADTTDADSARVKAVAQAIAARRDRRPAHISEAAVPQSNGANVLPRPPASSTRPVRSAASATERPGSFRAAASWAERAVQRLSSSFALRSPSA